MMRRRAQKHLSMLAAAALVSGALAASAPAAEDKDKMEEAGVRLGVSAGNLLFVPLKAIAVSMGAFSGALSLVLMGGNDEVTRQVWRDTLRGPYVITPELARKAIGERPELEMNNGDMPSLPQ
jgi:hypothetical protein